MCVCAFVSLFICAFVCLCVCVNHVVECLFVFFLFFLLLLSCSLLCCLLMGLNSLDINSLHATQYMTSFVVTKFNRMGWASSPGKLFSPAPVQTWLLKDVDFLAKKGAVYVFLKWTG